MSQNKRNSGRTTEWTDCVKKLTKNMENNLKWATIETKSTKSNKQRKYTGNKKWSEAQKENKIKKLRKLQDRIKNNHNNVKINKK